MPSSPIAGHHQARIDSEASKTSVDPELWARRHERGSRRRHTVSQDNQAHEPQAHESGGLLHRLFGRGGHETPGPDAHAGPSTRTTLDLGDIQGFILRGYRMPMVRHFLLKVGVHAKARALLARLVSVDASD